MKNVAIALFIGIENKVALLSTAGLTGFSHPSKKGVLKAWGSLTQTQKDSFANEDLRVGARRFSVPWILTTIDAPYLPNLDVQVWDHLDQPGKQ